LDNFNVATIYGGQSYDPQLRQLRRGVQVVVGTPGRVIDHIKRGTLDISQLQCLVLDEADEMLNMGFLEDVQFVLKQTPKDRQIALFSATLPEQIRAIAQDYLNDPAKIIVKKKNDDCRLDPTASLVCSPARQDLRIVPDPGGGGDGRRDCVYKDESSDAAGFRALAASGTIGNRIEWRHAAKCPRTHD
jgi:superfamily II DNA/RNA helicase